MKMYILNPIIFIICVFVCLSKLATANNIDFFKGVWLCKSEISNGFNWKEGKWVQVNNFNVEEYIFKTKETDCWNRIGNVEYKENMFCGNIETTDIANQIDSTYPFYFIDKSTFNDEAYISGYTMNYSRFKMSEKGNFVLLFNTPGNLDSNRSYKDSMSVSVGKCTKVSN